MTDIIYTIWKFSAISIMVSGIIVITIISFSIATTIFSKIIVTFILLFMYLSIYLVLKGN